jgi:hypothetical protein
MTTFTNILPRDDAFGADASYIVIDRKNGLIYSPVSALQITHERFGFAKREDCSWAKLSPEMIQGLLQPAQGATDDSKLNELRANCRSALNRVDAAHDMLEAAMDDLESAILDAQPPVKTIDK